MRQQTDRQAAEAHLQPSTKTGKEWPVKPTIRPEATTPAGRQ